MNALAHQFNSFYTRIRWVDNNTVEFESIDEAQDQLEVLYKELHDVFVEKPEPEAIKIVLGMIRVLKDAIYDYELNLPEQD